MPNYHATSANRGYWELEANEIINVEETNIPRKGQTVSGYGKNLPTRYVITLKNKRKYRVKVVCFSNSGTAYISTKERNFICVENALEAYDALHSRHN